MTPATRAALTRAADAAGLPAASVLALAVVETAGDPLWRLGDLGDWPPLRPEGHVFWRLLPPDLRQRAADLGLAWPRYRRGAGPRSRRAAVETYQRMAEVDAEAAAGATSWGLAQVMGHHGPALGLRNARALATRAREGVEGQADIALRYVGHAGLAADLAALPDRRAAERFAAGYNGPRWRDNDYAGKLVAAWHAVQASALAPADAPLPVPSPRSVLALQQRLAALGHNPGRIDGMHGARTAAALRAFQQAEGLVADGQPGPLTWQALDDAAADARAETAPARRRKVTAMLIGGGVLADEAADPAALLGQATQAVEGVTEAARQSGILEALGPLGTAAALGLIVWLAWPHVERWLGGEGGR